MPITSKEDPNEVEPLLASYYKLCLKQGVGNEMKPSLKYKEDLRVFQ